MFEQLHDGSLYFPMAGEILDVQNRCLEKLYDYNHTRPSENERRAALLREMFCEIGENCYIEPPFHANWGGHFVHFGSNVYANFGLTLVDDTHIYVGDNVMFGPNVVVATAGHPILPGLRECGNKGRPRKRRGSRESLLRAAPDRGARQAVLFPR